MILTPGQLNVFWRMFYRALKANFGGEKVSDETREAWRKEQLGECGFESLARVDRTHGFDRVMLHFAVLAQDAEAIGYWAPAVERRMRFLIQERLVSLGALEGKQIGWKYVTAILHHMHLPESIDDCPAALLFKAYEALDTHCRRLERKESRGAR